MSVRIRRSHLADMLGELRRRSQHDIQDLLRARRSGGRRDVGDALDHTDSDAESDLGVALLQMKMETLAHIDRALARLTEGSYGQCLACDQEIAEARLRALPFALRCRACEAAREELSSQAPSGLEQHDGLFTGGFGL